MNRPNISLAEIYDRMDEYEQMAVEFVLKKERERIIKELEEATVIVGADCFGEGFECIPTWKAIEIVKGGGEHENS